MTQNDLELLNNYVREGSEPAFAELVNRHVGLVYSTALRQLNGAPQLAEDVTQTVFCSLAKKASQLTAHTSLAGWLYTSVRYAASDARRAEQRRSLREQESYAMNRLAELDGAAADWEQLRPVIDETMNELDGEDREAVLLRYFQGCPLAEIGDRLGIKENAARMRVDRALEKLRVALVKRGITSTAVILATSLTSYAISTVPTGLAAKVCQAALVGNVAVVTGSGLALLLGNRLMKFSIAAGIAAIIAIPVIYHAMSVRQAPAQLQVASVSTTTQSVIVATTPPSANTQSNPAASGNGITLMEPRLMIQVDDPKTGKPVANVRFDDRFWVGNKFKNRQFYSDKNGWCEVIYPTNLTEIQLTSELDGYADTRLEWHPTRGDKIPETYALHLAPAVPIGGQVVDANGVPVAGAKVGWNHNDDPTADIGIESHQFSWIQVTTDAAGRWQINRIAEDMIHRIYGSAENPEYVDSDMVFAGRDPSVAKALREGSYVFKLGLATKITGVVVDANGRPVSAAKILVGHISSSDRREVTADASGTFTIPGGKPGDNLLTANASGFAATTIAINTTNDVMPYKLVLTKGSLLKMRVQNKAGDPIPNANARLNTFNPGMFDLPHYNAKRTQVDFHKKSDADGWLIWSNAPAGELDFQFAAEGYVYSENIYLTADGQDHIITLHPALVISGVVNDGDTGESIQHFRMGIGWPAMNYSTGKTNGNWSSIARFWPEFSGGQYSNVMEEAAIGGTANPGYILRFEAEGYTPFISRVIAPDEGPVHFDVLLHRQVSTSIAVLGVDGQPAINTEIGLLSHDAHLRLVPGGFSKDQSGTSVLHTDATGHFLLPTDASITRVIIANPSGYAEAAPADLQKIPAVTLQPWGRVEVTCLSHGQPVVGREYLFDLGEDDSTAINTDFTAFKVMTDDQGKFTLPMVPPGKHDFTRLIVTYTNPGGPGDRSWIHGDKTEVDILPGATTTVTFGDKGYTVTAKLQWPGGKPLANLQNVMITLQTPMPSMPKEIIGNRELMMHYLQTPEYLALAKAARHYPMSITADGSLAADDVPPGNYSLSAFAILKAEGGKPNGSLSSQRILVTVPSDPPTGQLDAGTIELVQPRTH